MSSKRKRRKAILNTHVRLSESSLHFAQRKRVSDSSRERAVLDSNHSRNTDDMAYPLSDGLICTS